MEELILLLQGEKIAPSDKPFYTKASRLAVLKEVKKILLKAKMDSLLGRAA